MTNILYNPETRNRHKAFISIFKPYYQNQKLSLKEKLYTYFFRLEYQRYIVAWESDYFDNIEREYRETYNSIRIEFKKDFIEYSLNP